MLQRADGGKGRKQEGGRMGEKRELGRAEAAAECVVCVCVFVYVWVGERDRDWKREHGSQHHPPRLGGGEERRRACSSNRQKWKESGNERQTWGEKRSTMKECHCPSWQHWQFTICSKSEGRRENNIEKGREEEEEKRRKSNGAEERWRGAAGSDFVN